MKIIVLILISLLMLSCDENNFPKVYLLDQLRIIGVTVDTPEITDPGAPVAINVTPIIADYNGAGRTLTLTIVGCIDPGIGVGADPSCENSLDRTVLSPAAAIPMAGGSGFYDTPNFIGPVNTAYNISIPTGTLALRSSIDQFNGVAYILELIVTTGSEEIRTFKRIIISTKTANQNPPTPSIEVNGAAAATLPSGEATISLSIAGTISESYGFKNSAGITETINEETSLAWFVTGGEIDYDKLDPTDSAKWKAPSSAPLGQNVVILGLVRDNRGGLSFVKHEF